MRKVLLLGLLAVGCGQGTVAAPVVTDTQVLQQIEHQIEVQNWILCTRNWGPQTTGNLTGYGTPPDLNDPCYGIQLNPPRY